MTTITPINRHQLPLTLKTIKTTISCGSAFQSELLPVMNARSRVCAKCMCIYPAAREAIKKGRGRGGRGKKRGNEEETDIMNNVM